MDLVPYCKPTVSDRKEEEKEKEKEKEKKKKRPFLHGYLSTYPCTKGQFFPFTFFH